MKHRVAIFGCGRMGQIYAQAYSTYPDTEIVGISDVNADRLKAVGQRFGVSALFPDIDSLLRETSPDVVAVVCPTKYMKNAVLAAAEFGVKGVSTDKPIAGVLADADAMVAACEERGIVYAGGNLQRAMHEVQAAASRVRVSIGSAAKSRAADASTLPSCACLPMPRSKRLSPGERLKRP